MADAIFEEPRLAEIYGEGEIVRIDPRTNAVTAHIRVQGRPEDAVGYAGSLWVSNEDGTLQRVDTKTNSIVARIRVGADPDNVIACAGKL